MFVVNNRRVLIEKQTKKPNFQIFILFFDIIHLCGDFFTLPLSLWKWDLCALYIPSCPGRLILRFNSGIFAGYLGAGSKFSSNVFY